MGSSGFARSLFDPDLMDLEMMPMRESPPDTLTVGMMTPMDPVMVVGCAIVWSVARAR